MAVLRLESDRLELCSICLEAFTHPRILPCCHTFCTKCLESIFGVLGEQEGDHHDCSSPRPVENNKRGITCPLCKKLCILPLQGVKGFPLDYKVLQDSEYEKLKLSLVSGKLEEIEKCACCPGDNDEKLIGSCVNCGGFLCESCVELHKRLHTFAEHNVDDVSEATESLLTPRLKISNCVVHHREFNSYCDQCEKLICPECAIKSHKKCTGESHVRTIEEAGDCLVNEVEKLKVSAEQKLVESIRYQFSINRLENDFLESDHARELEKQINSVFDILISELKQQHSALLAKVEENDNAVKKAIWAQKSEVEMVIKQVQSGLSFVKRANSCVNPAERILMNVQGRNLLKNVLSSGVNTWNITSLPKPLAHCTTRSCDDVGGVLKEIESCDITVGVDFNYIVKVSNPIRINIAHSECLLKLIPTVRILYGLSKQMIESSVVLYKDENEKWTVEFVPCCAGKHCLNLLIGGRVVHSFEFVVGGQLKRGDKVQRGPDWILKEGDGSGNLLNGTVVKFESEIVTVKWGKITENEVCETSSLLLSEQMPQKETCRAYELPSRALGEAALSYSPEVTEDERTTTPEYLPSDRTMTNEVSDSVTTEIMQDVMLAQPLAAEPEEPEFLDTEEYETSESHHEHANLEYVTKEHVWGKDGVYEVELILTS